jgi:type IV secretion system protein TrbG
MYRIISISLILVFLFVPVASSQTLSDAKPGTLPISVTPVVSPLKQQTEVEGKKEVEEEKKTPEDVHGEASAKKVVRHATNEARQEYKDLVTLQGKVFFNYSDTSLYDMFCKEGHISDIQLQPGEDLLYVGGGDTVRWIIDKAQSGSGDAKQWHVLVKPLKSKIVTNFIITTDKHTYQICAKSTDFFNPLIGWLYPAEEKMALLRSQAEEKKKDDNNVSSKVSPEKLCFTYSIKSKKAWHVSPYSWQPKMVFDDGLKTYIQMADGMKAGEAPALFVKDDAGVNLANYRVKDNFYIVDRLFNQAELRNGMKETVVITRKEENSRCSGRGE